VRIVITKRETLDIPDGIGVFIFHLAEEFIKQGHDVTVTGCAPLNRERIGDFYALQYFPRLLVLKAPRTSTYAERLAIWIAEGRSAINRLKPDLVIVNGVLPLSFSGATVTVAHDLERRHPRLSFVRVAYKRYAYRRSDYIVATCSELQAALSAELRIHPGQIHVIPTCVVSGTYGNKPFEERENAVLHLGTVDYKNPVATIRAFSLLGPEARLYITGPPDEAVTRCISTLDSSVSRRIKLLGYISSAELRALLGSVRVVSVPSAYRLPVASPTVLESFASGTPVVGTPGISGDLLVHGENGYVCQPADYKGISAAIQTLLQNEQVWSGLANQALVTSEKFSTSAVARAYLHLLRENRCDTFDHRDLNFRREASAN
jgi:glycosyltransferase involved in cell wall biosynthesis